MGLLFGYNWKIMAAINETCLSVFAKTDLLSQNIQRNCAAISTALQFGCQISTNGKFLIGLRPKITR